MNSINLTPLVACILENFIMVDISACWHSCFKARVYAVCFDAVILRSLLFEKIH